MREQDFPSFDEEMFDDEQWDHIAWLIPDLIKTGTFEVWLELMTPVWQEQILKLKKEGWLDNKDLI